MHSDRAESGNFSDNADFDTVIEHYTQVLSDLQNELNALNDLSN